MTRLRGDDSTSRDRKAIAATVDTLLDTMVHGTGFGLRGGRCRIGRANSLILKGCRFVSDLAVTGKVTFHERSHVIKGRVTITGRGSDEGGLRIRPLPRSNIVTVEGLIGGRSVYVAFPIRN